MKKVEEDFADLLKLFNKHGVEYCIIGAFAVAFHSIPRYTKDMDILVQPSIENGRKIVKALEEFGFKGLKLTAEDFSEGGHFIQLGYEPVRVDIITSIEGCDSKKVFSSRVKGKFGRNKVFFINLEELIRNKKKSNRRQDQADLETLFAFKKRLSKKSES